MAYTVTNGLYFTIWGADTFEPISTKLGKVVVVDDGITQSSFGFNNFKGCLFTEVKVSVFPIDFAGHRYNSAAAAATAQLTSSL